MANQKKPGLPGSAIGLYICAGIMLLLFVFSIVGIAIGGQDGTRPFFIMTSLVTAVMVLACLLSAKWLTEKAASRKKTFASYAFEGEFAPPKKNLVYPQKKKTEKR